MDKNKGKNSDKGKEKGKMMEFTINLAKEAGRLVMENYGRIKTKERKADDSFVTNADKEAEALIISKIKERYPSHSILSEEAGGDKKISDHRWIIDPIDGTRNFIAQIPFFSVSIGLAKDNMPYLGVVYFPALDEIYYAEKGKGAYLNGKRIHVSDKGPKDGPVMAYGANLQKGTEWHMRKIPEFLKLTDRIRMLGCATTNLCFLAAGRFDAFVGRYGFIWDYAASLVIAGEAGARITDLNGQPYTIDTKDFVISNGKLHDELIKITRS